MDNGTSIKLVFRIGNGNRKVANERYQILYRVADTFMRVRQANIDYTDTKCTFEGEADSLITLHDISVMIHDNEYARNALIELHYIRLNAE